MTATPGDYWPYHYVAPPFVYQSTPCPHCYCEDAAGYKDHLQCCKCYTRMHKKFVTPIRLFDSAAADRFIEESNF